MGLLSHGRRVTSYLSGQMDAIRRFRCVGSAAHEAVVLHPLCLMHQLAVATMCQAELGFDSVAPETRDVPFISHTAGVPSAFCHRMSALPSPLKSPALMTCQAEPGLNPAAPPEESVKPFMNQMTGVPSSYCQRMSDLPSALKS